MQGPFDKRTSIKDLFATALEQDPASRSAFLHERCEDAEICFEVERLLREHEEAGTFLSTPFLEGLTGVVSDPTFLQRLGKGDLFAGRFRISHFIAAGGMGEVYAAEDMQLERTVALKFLSLESARELRSLVRFQREAKAASALNHPNICTVYDIGEDRGRAFIAMELLEGETLSTRLKRGPCTLEEGLRIALSISSALVAAHSKGIIHRDIKPGNIMLTPSGAKLLDFGLALHGQFVSREPKITATLTGEANVVGTLPYMPPEQLRGEETDGRGDIFSFGAVLYEMFTGKGAFKGLSTIDTIAAITGMEPTPIRELTKNLPEGLETLIRRCLRKKVGDRYQTASEVESKLNECLTAAREPASGINLKVLTHHAKRPKILALLALSLVLLASYPAWWFYRSSKAKWAVNQALPRIGHLIDDDKFDKAFALALEADRYIPHDSRLVNYLSEISWSPSIKTEPSGASVYRKRYNSPDEPWEFVGTSPIDGRRFPVVDSVWKFELKGYTTVERATFPYGPMFVKLDEAGKAPPGMVHISVTKPLGKGSPGSLHGLAGYEDLPAVELSDFWMDKFEVTNRDFKRFVDQGGYEKAEYWKNQFVKDGHVLTWAEAMKLFRDKTGNAGPSSWIQGDYPTGQGDYPVTGVSWFEADAYAHFVGKKLPTVYHWLAAAFPPDGPGLIPASNFNEVGLARVGKYEGMSWSGAFDLAGNAKEWIHNEERSGKRYILGGAWNEPTYMFYHSDARSPFDRSSTFGFRCAIYTLGSGEAKAALAIPIEIRDYNSEKPVSNAVFNVYKSLYSYDKTPLHAVVESLPGTDLWNEEKITFDAAYGNEKVIAYLFLPKNASPPYKTVVHFNGAAALYEKSSWPLNPAYLEDFDYMIKSGRAVMFPVYKGSFDRWDDFPSWPKVSSFYRDSVIDWSKDLGRSIDYLETRPDIDTKSLAYEGTSMGAAMGGLLPAMEPRLKVLVLVSPGFYLQKRRPEVDQINFAPRIKVPVLMINGRFDFLFPVDSSQEPMYRSFGTPPNLKRRIVYDTGHDIPRVDEIKESLDWLDRFQGPVTKR